jgi:hypothetical protein
VYRGRWGGEEGGVERESRWKTHYMNQEYDDAQIRQLALINSWDADAVVVTNPSVGFKKGSSKRDLTRSEPL